METGQPTVGDMSPWGTIDNVEHIADGVDFVSTAGHGGIKLSAGRNSLMPSYFGSTSYGEPKNGWYEEDCQQCLVYLRYPELMSNPTADRWRGLIADAKSAYPEAVARWERATTFDPRRTAALADGREAANS